MDSLNYSLFSRRYYNPARTARQGQIWVPESDDFRNFLAAFRDYCLTEKAL